MSRLKEQKLGKFNFQQLYEEADQLRPPYLDHASYIGPVEVRQTKERGRGLFTTVAVKAGDLLLAEKAFTYNYLETEKEALRSSGRQPKATVLMYQETDTVNDGSEAGLIKMVVQKLFKNPSLMSAVANLYYGDYPSGTLREVDGLPVIDTFLIERLVYLNAFQSPLTTRSEHLYIAAQNPTSTSGKNLSSGIWIQASYINHSCVPNTSRSYIGDMQFIRASEDLPANTEIVHSYQPISESSKFMENWGFHCDCPICTDLRTTNTKTLAKRRTFVADTKAFFRRENRIVLINLDKFNPEKLERDIAEIEKTFNKPASQVPRVILWAPCLALVRVYAFHDRKEKVIWAVAKTLENFGYVITGLSFPSKKGESRELKVEKWGMPDDYVVDCWMHLWTAFELLGQIDKASRARELAKRTYLIVVGEDVTFGKIYEEKGKACVEQRKLWDRL